MLRYMKKSLIYAFIALFGPVALAANVYKWTDDQGKVHYGDKSEAGAEKMKLKESPANAPQLGNNPDTSNQKAGASTGQFTISIATPRPHETVRSVDGKISVSLTVNPIPEVGIKVTYRFYLDGKLVGGDAGGQTNMELTGVGRGSHSIRAEMLNGDGAILAGSPEVSFYVRQPELEEGGKSTSGSNGSFKPDYSSDSKASGSTYSPTKADYSSKNTATSSTYKPTKPSNSPSSKASSTTYKPSYGSSGFKPN